MFNMYGNSNQGGLREMKEWGKKRGNREKEKRKLKCAS